MKITSAPVPLAIAAGIGIIIGIPVGYLLAHDNLYSLRLQELFSSLFRLHNNTITGQAISTSTDTPILFTIAEDLVQMQIKAAVDESDIG